MACFFIAMNYGTASASRYFLSLAEELSVQGHQVIVLVDEQRYEAEKKTGNPIIATWPSKVPTRWRDAQFLQHLIRKFSPDCIMANFSSANLCILLGWANRAPQRVVWYHTISAAIEMDTQAPGWKSWLLVQRKRWIYSLATVIVANSKAASMDVQQVYKVRPENCYVLPILISEPKVRNRDITANKVVCVGRLSRSKGQATLIRAASYMKQITPSFQIDFVGDGPERKNYQRLAVELGVEENCRFLGARQPAEVFETLASAAVCVTTSRHEAFGLANVEAMSVGTPVVASDVDGIREVVVDGETGFLVPPDDPEAFGDKILYFLRNPSLRQEFSEGARAHFDKTFSLKNIAQHANFFVTLVNAGNS